MLFDDICIGTDGMRCKVRTATLARFSTQLSCILIARGYGEIGRRTGFRFQRGNPQEFKSPYPHHQFYLLALPIRKIECLGVASAKTDGKNQSQFYLLALPTRKIECPMQYLAQRHKKQSPNAQKNFFCKKDLIFCYICPKIGRRIKIKGK